MHYLALLYGDETATQPSGPALAEEVARYDEFDRAAGEAVVAGEALEPTSAGVTIRPGPDGPVVTEGVFSEATEVVGGFYVLEADDLDRAIELAQRIPAAEDGAVELRPLVQWFELTRRPPDGARRYLALLAGEEGDADQPGTAAWDAAVSDHERFGGEAGEWILGGGALYPAESATVVRVRGGEVLTTEGTFAEASEIVGGLYLLWGPSLAAAVDVAAKIPVGSTDHVQLRPILELD